MFLMCCFIVPYMLVTESPDNTHLSQRHPLDVVLGRLQCPMDSPFFGVLVFGTGCGCGNVRLVSIPILFLAQPMGRLLDGYSTYFTQVLMSWDVCGMCITYIIFWCFLFFFIILKPSLRIKL